MAKIKGRQVWAVFRPDHLQGILIKGVFADPDVVEGEVDRLNRLRAERGEPATYTWQACAYYEGPRHVRKNT